MTAENVKARVSNVHFEHQWLKLSYFFKFKVKIWNDFTDILISRLHKLFLFFCFCLALGLSTVCHWRGNTDLSRICFGVCFNCCLIPRQICCQALSSFFIKTYILHTKAWLVLGPYSWNWPLGKYCIQATNTVDTHSLHIQYIHGITVMRKTVYNMTVGLISPFGNGGFVSQLIHWL